MNTKVWIISLLIIFLLTLFVNSLGAKGFFNGKGQAEVSAKYPTFITPNNFAFSIWGVIYTLLLITLLYFFFQRKDPAVTELIHAISGLFILTSLFNMAWIVSFSYEKMASSTFFILGMLLSLMTIVKEIQATNPSLGRTLAGTSFTLYASWVFIATFINFAVFFIQKEWNRFGLSDSIWTLVILMIAIIFVSSYVFVYQNAVFPIALAWAFYGIYSSYQEGKIKAERAASIQKLLLTGIAIFFFWIVYSFMINGLAIFPA